MLQFYAFSADKFIYVRKYARVKDLTNIMYVTVCSNDSLCMWHLSVFEPD